MPTLNYQTPPPPRDWQSYLWDRNAGEWLVWAVLFYLSSILIGESRWALRYVIVGRLVWLLLVMSMVTNLMSWRCARRSTISTIVSVVLILWTLEAIVPGLFNF